jgi:hypothetical protein
MLSDTFKVETKFNTQRLNYDDALLYSFSVVSYQIMAVFLCNSDAEDKEA